MRGLSAIHSSFTQNGGVHRSLERNPFLSYQLPKLVFVDDRNVVIIGIIAFRLARICADHEVVRIPRDAARRVRAVGLDRFLGLASGHALERARKDEGESLEFVAACVHLGLLR